MESSRLRKQRLSRTLNEMANVHPERLFCIQAMFMEDSTRWQQITIREFSAAVNTTAWWIHKTIGTATTSLAYLGANDIRYCLVALACMKTGHTVLFPSPRNSPAASVHVFRQVSCGILLCSSERLKIVPRLFGTDSAIHMVEFPDLVDLLTKSEDTFPCNEDTAYEEDDVNIIIHSSGTTGLPKPVRLTNGFWSALDNIDFIGVPLGRKSAVIHSIAPGKVFFTMAPFFHLMGLVSLIESLCHATPFAIGPEQPMTSNLLAEIIGKINPATILLPPSIIEDIASSKRGRELFSHFEAVFFAGAPLAIEVGDSLCRETLVQGLIGSTEAGFISNLVLDKGDDWVWFEWNPAYELDMELSMDEMYEMVIHRGASRDFQGIFHTHPDLKEYRTKDLFTPHPSKPGLWRYTGRLDDVIILSNGEKFNPVDMEKVIEGHPLISKALFIGQGRFRAAVLVELVWETGTRSETEEALVEQIWTAVQQANVIAPAYAQVSKRDIIFASPDRPFQITPKGTTNRHSTLATYSDEIETLYSERNAWEKDISSPLTVQDVAHKVAKVVSELGFSDAVSPDDNLFTLGMDSLQTFQLVKSLQSFLISGMANSETIAISAQDIYANPSVNQISQFLLQSQSDKKARPQYITVDSKSRNFNLLNLVAKYSQGFPTSSVMLTGSTGSLGAYILDELIARKIFVKIYCINRSNEARSRQCLGWEKRHPGVVFDVGHRVEFLQANLSLPQLGLPDSKYAELKKRVGCIIHCSWEVDFNHPLEAFEHTHIQGVRRLVDFSLESSHDAHLHLVSSIATMGAWKTIHGPCIPEKLQQDPDVVLSQGYAESKFVAESICALASQRSGVPITVHRVGQIAGPRKGSGLWNKKEWLPSLIATSKTLGQIPTSLGSMPIDWIPVDTVAKIIVDVIESRNVAEHQNEATVCNIVNPLVSTWESLLEPIVARYSLQTVTLQHWIDLLETFRSPTDVDIQDKPALKLMSFFRGLLLDNGRLGSSLNIETSQAQALSETMRLMSPIDPSLMENWLDQWRF